jgi:hypothetical protein
MSTKNQEDQDGEQSHPCIGLLLGKFLAPKQLKPSYERPLSLRDTHDDATVRSSCRGSERDPSYVKRMKQIRSGNTR